jgi:hypothetical protein
MIRKLYPYVAQYRFFLIVCFLLVWGEVIDEMMMPLLMAKIVDYGISMA